jgi:hypothetical protein
MQDLGKHSNLKGWLKNETKFFKKKLDWKLKLKNTEKRLKSETKKGNLNETKIHWKKTENLKIETENELN